MITTPSARLRMLCDFFLIAQPLFPSFKGGEARSAGVVSNSREASLLILMLARSALLLRTTPHPAADKSNLSAIDRFHASNAPPALRRVHEPQSHPHLPPSHPNTRPSADTARCSAQPDIHQNTCTASLPHRPLPSTFRRASPAAPPSRATCSLRSGTPGHIYRACLNRQHPVPFFEDLRQSRLVLVVRQNLIQVRLVLLQREHVSCRTVHLLCVFSDRPVELLIRQRQLRLALRNDLVEGVDQPGHFLLIVLTRQFVQPVPVGFLARFSLVVPSLQSPDVEPGRRRRRIHTE